MASNLIKAPPTGSEEWRVQHEQRKTKLEDFDYLDRLFGGQFGLGNINLNNRNIYVYPEKENEGSFSSLESITITDKDGKYILLPKVDETGNMLSEDEAIRKYALTGQYLGKFDSDEEATNYAIGLEKRQNAFYNSTPIGKMIKELAFSNLPKQQQSDFTTTVNSIFGKYLLSTPEYSSPTPENNDKGLFESFNAWVKDKNRF